jgi:fatty acid synthase, animal type
MDESESICRGKIRMADDNDFLIKNIGIIPSTAKDNLLMKEDFYKELRVRGYQYKDDFALVEKVQCFSNLPYRYGEIEWKGNFLCFVDAVGQAFFTNKDSRELMLPTFLRRVTINNIKHNQMLNDLTNCRKVVDDEGGEKIFFDLLIDEVNHAFRCGGVEIVGIESQILNRRKTAGPVLETYEFIPNFPTPIMSMKNVAKFCIQVLYDATTSMKHKFVELEDGEEENSIMKFLVEASNDTILSNPEFHLFTNNKIDELKQIKINELDEFSRIENVDFLVTSKWKNEYFEKINDLGMLLLRNSNDEVLELHKSLKNVACIQMENEKLLLFKKAETSKFNGDIFEVPETQESFEWIENLKKILETCDNIIIYSKSEMSGILGFFKTLKKEYSDKMIKCFIIEDDLAPMFDPKNSFYADQLDMGLSINIYKNGKWGSFKHLDFNQEIEKKPQSNHAFVHLLKSGLTSSISWVNGDLDVNDENNIDIHYSALNFRDILVANSRISLEHSYSSRKCAQYKIGLEFSGKTKDGRRVAGLHESKCISNSVKKLMVEDKDLCFNVPDNISLEDAATVPVVYLTVYVAFFIKANIKSGQSILIHSGSGGVGLAAIQTAFAYGLEVFTTCGSEEKREFLLKEFPQLKNENIGNSRNTSFEQMIMKQTKGVGVDYVMNSLVEDKMHASLRCLAKYGTFFEIGKFDILMRNKIDLSNYLRDIKYIVIDISEDYFYADDKTVLRKLFNQIEDDIKKGWVKPIIRKVFDANDVQKAFKYMTTGKHVGKILLKIRENEDDKVTLPIQVRPYVFFDPEKSYVLVGGLGGMGMEIADWMIMRNCKKLVFSSSRGISNSFQSYRLRIWQTYEVDVVVNTSDVTTKEGCTELLEEANRLGQVGGIFNLAAILSDAKFSEQTIKSFEKSYKPKALSTKYLDEVSRVLCPYLDHFVFFSSASAGRGMGSQTNYSLSNSVGEKIILNRHEAGFPAKAIQFGPIRDVGLLSRMNKEISSLAGFIFQSMNSCFEVLDKILLTDEPIFSSIIIASQFTTGKSFREVHKIILESIGVTDESTIGEDKTLSELGVDSLSGYEIQQGIQRETGVIMTLKEIRSKTYWELKKECEELAKKKNRY